MHQLVKIVFDGFEYLWASTNKPKSNLKCLRKSSVCLVTTIHGMYVHDVLLSGGKKFRHNTTNTISLIAILPGTFLNGKQLQISLAHSLITWILRSMSAACYFSAVVLRSEYPGILSRRHSNSQSIRNRYTVKPRLR